MILRQQSVDPGEDPEAPFFPSRATGTIHLLGLISGARLNAKNTAIYISHITSRRQIEQDERVAKGIIDDGESTNRDLSRLEDHLSACLDDGLNGLRH
jgi:hypothetical protein